GIIEYVRDITERRRVEEELRQSEEKYRLLIENIQEGVFIIQDSRFQYGNKTFAGLLGCTLEEIIGRDFREFVAPEDVGLVIDHYHRRMAGEKVPHEYEFHGLRRDGTKIIVNMNVGLVTYQGRIASMGILKDITERKKVEEKIRNYTRELEESNRMKELFTDIMHHDLLNPLNTANGFIELLKENETISRKKAYLETIERSLVKGMELIDSAMKFSRFESLKSIELEELDLKKIIEEVIEALTPMADNAGMEIINRITLNMPVRANKIIEEVFSNLLSNAIKYASSGKRIIIESENKGESLQVRIIDFGEGIKESDKTMIFERFGRGGKTGVKGSGLGLAIAGKIMELHNGRIWVEDNPEGGSIFIVEIPGNLNQSH
ncbi:MAG: PAS domain-containing sensor histidine kinase, partial [Candidatus Methanoperedens sp.]|nr:PAS domain-containing sensor histidine kinase [Candidatus Methanoperedens sp.]